MKTNQPGKQNPLFLYVDKIVFGVLVLAALYYCYSAASLEQIAWTPDQLTQDSTSAQQNIDKSEFREELKVVEYETRARDIRIGFPHRNYQTTEKWEAAVFPEKIKRGVPKVLELIKLRAVAGVGAVKVRERESVFGGNTASTGGMSDMGAFGGGGMTGGMTGTGIQAGAKLETTHWVLLTGLIQYEEQLREYIRTFANAMYSSPDDYPVYLFIDVERNEIGVNNPDGTPVWIRLDVDTEFSAQQTKWAGTGLDPVDFQYTIPPPSLYVAPTASLLPPLANRQFGQEVAYPPYIPLMSDTLRAQILEQQKIYNDLLENRRLKNRDDLLKNENNELDIFIGAMGGGMSGGYGGGMGGGMSGGMGGNTGASQLPGMYNPGSGMGGTGRSGGMGGDYGGMSGSMTGGMGRSGGMGGMGSDYGGMGGNTANNTWWVYTKTPPTVMVEANYRLFRYFDFTVEPEKSYQYRVRLAVKNPNHKLADRFLDDDAVKDKTKVDLWTDFSFPTGQVAVNSNTRIVAKSVGNVPAANRAWLSQNATVSSIVFDTSDNEDYIAKDINVTVGQVLNFPRRAGEKVSSLTSSSGMSGDSSMMGGMSSPTGVSGSGTTGRGNTQTAKAQTKSLDHISNQSVIDVVGKRRLIGSNNEHTPAGQVMLMAADGTIEIQSIKTNKLELDRYEKPVASTTGMGGMMSP